MVLVAMASALVGAVAATAAQVVFAQVTAPRFELPRFGEVPPRIVSERVRSRGGGSFYFVLDTKTKACWLREGSGESIALAPAPAEACQP
jgi:hypothetical protein